MSREVYRDRVPGAKHRFSMAGNEYSLDSAMPEVVAVAGEPVTLSVAPTSLLQVLAVELAEADLLRVFTLLGTEPGSELVQRELLPALKRRPRIVSALTLTWTADMARTVGEALVEAADIAESDPLLDGTSDDADASDDLHLSGLQP